MVKILIKCCWWWITGQLNSSPFNT